MQQTRPRLALASLLASTLVLSTGCALQSQQEEIVIQPMPALTKHPAHAEVAWVELDRHSVVARTDGYRHVITDGPQWWYAGERDASTVPSTEIDADREAGHEGKDQEAESPEATPFPLSKRDAAIEVEAVLPPTWSGDEMAAWRDRCMMEPVNKAQLALLGNMEPPGNPALTCQALHRAAAGQDED